MSTGEPTPNRIEIIARAVAARCEEGIHADELRRLLAPPVQPNANRAPAAGDSESSVVSRALSETVALGFVRRERDRCYPGTVLPAPGADAFRAQLAAILLDPNHQQHQGQEDVPRALAWFLDQDPTRPIRFTGADVPKRIEAEYGPEVGAFGLTNESPRWHQFTYWACYLGYAWRLSYSTASDFVVPDPTEALVRILEPLLRERGQVPIREARAAWATASSVLDGGIVRNELHARRERRPPDDRTPLSASTSLALQRLEERGLLQLSEASNAPTAVLQLGNRRQPVSHLTLVGRA